MIQYLFKKGLNPKLPSPDGGPAEEEVSPHGQISMLLNVQQAFSFQVHTFSFFFSNVAGGNTRSRSTLYQAHTCCWRGADIVEQPHQPDRARQVRRASTADTASTCKRPVRLLTPILLTPNNQSPRNLYYPY